MKKLRIAQIAPLWTSIPPEKYGGIELVVYNLTEELVKRGHKVTLFASGDSKTSAKLSSVYPRALLKDKIPWRETAYDLMNLAEALKHSQEFDIVHSHIDLYDLFFRPLVKTPMVSTLHNNIFAPRKNKSGRIYAYNYYKNHNFVSISLKQQKNATVKLNFVANVYNGLNPENYKLNLSPENKFIWIARVEEAKGILSAITAVEKLGVKLDIAGRIDPVKMDFFNSQVKPHLNSKIRYIGEIDKKLKSKFFGSGKALLYPIEWEEPFGLVMTESMACGTPVIAFKRGSVPEVVKQGKTGFVVKQLDNTGKTNIWGLVEAIAKIDEIDRRFCRKYFEEKFSSEVMTDEYEKVYQRILNKR